MNVFEAAHRLLLAYSDLFANPGDRAPFHDLEQDNQNDAYRLLVAVEYLQASENGTGIRPTTADTATLENRLALLRLAAGFERAFQLPLPHAPGAVFFGAMVDPDAFEIPGHNRAGVGGRGLTFRRAFESCVGEAAEFLSFIEHRNDPLLLNRPGNDATVVGPSEWLLAGLGLNDLSALDENDWIEARSLSDGRTVRVPSELILRRPADRRKALRQAESTGVGAGPTFDDAVLSGILEVIERDAIALWWFGGMPARPVGEDLTLSAGFTDFMTTIRADSKRPCRLLDITTDIGIPVFAAVSAEQDGSAAISGFSAHPDPLEAAKTAVLEMCQMEMAQAISVSRWQRDGPANLNEQDRVWVERYKNLTRSTFPQFQISGSACNYDFRSNNAPLEYVVSRLSSVGSESFVSDISRIDIDIPVVHVIIPGLQSSKPDWISLRFKKHAIANKKTLINLDNIPSPI